jgi:hypothetical protein
MTGGARDAAVKADRQLAEQVAYQVAEAQNTVEVLAASTIAPTRLQAKRRSIEARRVTWAAALVALLNEARAQNDEWAAAGLVADESDFDGQEFSGVRLTHLDVALFNQSTTVMNTMLTAFGNNNWDDLFNAMKQ